MAKQKANRKKDVTGANKTYYFRCDNYTLVATYASHFLWRMYPDKDKYIVKCTPLNIEMTANTRTEGRKMMIEKLQQMWDNRKGAAYQNIIEKKFRQADRDVDIIPIA